MFSVPTQEVCRCAGAQETRRSSLVRGCPQQGAAQSGETLGATLPADSCQRRTAVAEAAAGGRLGAVGWSSVCMAITGKGMRNPRDPAWFVAGVAAVTTYLGRTARPVRRAPGRRAPREAPHAAWIAVRSGMVSAASGRPAATASSIGSAACAWSARRSVVASSRTSAVGTSRPARRIGSTVSKGLPRSRHRSGLDDRPGCWRSPRRIPFGVFRGDSRKWGKGREGAGGGAVLGASGA